MKNRRKKSIWSSADNFKDYTFQHQKRRFRLRVYPSTEKALKIFMDDILRDVSISSGASSCSPLDFYYRDERQNQHHVYVTRETHWFTTFYEVYIDDAVVYSTKDKEPS